MLIQLLFCFDVHSHPGLLLSEFSFITTFFNIKIILATLFPKSHEAQTLHILECHWGLDFLKPRILMHEMRYIKKSSDFAKKHHYIRKSHLFSHNIFICKNRESEKIGNSPKDTQFSRAHSRAGILTLPV